jgi:hypothetical protein
MPRRRRRYQPNLRTAFHLCSIEQIAETAVGNTANQRKVITRTCKDQERRQRLPVICSLPQLQIIVRQKVDKQLAAAENHETDIDRRDDLAAILKALSHLDDSPPCTATSDQTRGGLSVGCHDEDARQRSTETNG